MNRNNGKRKKSFLQRTAKHGKKGNYGRGTNINEETFQYFLHILKVLNQDFETLEEKEIFAENVFRQLEGNEVSYCCNQVISFIVEKLIPFACDDIIVKFMNEFSTNPRPIFLDPYCSFVLQKLMIVCTKRLNDKLCSDNDELSQLYATYRNWILKMAKFAVNNLEYFAWDVHANPVIRTVLACLSGVPDLNIKMSENDYNKMKELCGLADEEFFAIVKSCITQMMTCPQFSELPFNNVVSGLLQIMLCVAWIVDKKLLKSLSSALLKCFSSPVVCVIESQEQLKNSTNHDESLSLIIENDSALRVLEAIISFSTQKRWFKIYTKFFTTNLLKLCMHSKANFTVQKLITSCPEKEQFELISNQLLSNLDEIFSSGNTGIILQLCKGCVKFKSMQSQFVQNWYNCVKCDSESTDVVRFFCTLYMSTKDNLNTVVSETDCDKSISKIALHGSLLLQSMLHFNKPIKIVKGILECETEKLVCILCDPRGSYIADAFFDNEYVGEKSKENFIKKLNGFYTIICCSKNGSRVFDVIWKCAKMNRKVSIVTELCSNQSTLESSKYGKCIARNISLHTFRHRKEHWISAQNGDKKIINLFADIL